LELRIGSRYVVREVIGRGAFGTVWRGDGPDGPVAVKILREEYAASPELVSAFIRERSALRRLSHPNIVRVHDLVAEGDVLALVMDLVDGTNLRIGLHERGIVPPVVAAALVATVADALATAHAAGVVHRDLKPENILLRPDSTPVLTDFGVAALVEQTVLRGAFPIHGTPHYMAPEIATGRPARTSADVYAVGILLYEMLAGRPPFTAQSPLAVLRQHVTAAPPRPTIIPDPLWNVVARCLVKDPQRRPSADALSRRLRALLERHAVAERRAIAPSEPSPADSTKALVPVRAQVPPSSDALPAAPARHRRRGTVLAGAVALGVGAATMCLSGGVVGWMLGESSDVPARTPDSPSVVAAERESWLDESYVYQLGNGLGPVEAGRANGGEKPDDGGPMTLGGIEYEHGLGVHAPSHVQLRPGGDCTRFRAQIGVDAEAARHAIGTVRFQVIVDGEPVFDEPATWDGAPSSVDLEVTGAEVIDLVVTDSDDGNDGDSAVWAGARLTCIGGSPGRA
jgi:hypothetical protein